MDNSNLKDVVKALSDAGVLSSELVGGVHLDEIEKLIVFGQDIRVIVADGNAIFSQFMALDDAGRADLDAYMASLPNFPSDLKVDGIVKRILLAVIACSAVAQAIEGIVS